MNATCKIVALIFAGIIFFKVALPVLIASSNFLIKWLDLLGKALP